FAGCRVDRCNGHARNLHHAANRIVRIVGQEFPLAVLHRSQAGMPALQIRGSYDYKRRPLGIKTRSSKSKKNWTSNASNAAGIAASSIVTRSFRFSPLIIGSPNPPAPISAASVAVPMLMTALVLIPARMVREAIDREIRRRRALLVSRSAVPDCRIEGAMTCKPVAVLRKIGSRP